MHLTPSNKRYMKPRPRLRERTIIPKEFAEHWQPRWPYSWPGTAVLKRRFAALFKKTSVMTWIVRVQGFERHTNSMSHAKRPFQRPSSHFSIQAIMKMQSGWQYR